MVNMQIKTNYSLGSTSYKNCVWLQKADWDLQDEQDFAQNFDSRRALRATVVTCNPDRHQLRDKYLPRKRSQVAKNIWLLRRLADRKLLGWAEIDCKISDFNDARFHYGLLEEDLTTLSLVRHLVSACFIAYDLACLRLFSSPGKQVARLPGAPGCVQKTVLIGGVSAEFVKTSMCRFDRTLWWDAELTAQDKKDLNYLQRRLDRHNEQLEAEKVRLYQKPKKRGLLARFFGGWSIGPDGGDWRRWSKRD